MTCQVNLFLKNNSTQSLPRLYITSITTFCVIQKVQTPKACRDQWKMNESQEFHKSHEEADKEGRPEFLLPCQSQLHSIISQHCNVYIIILKKNSRQLLFCYRLQNDINLTQEGSTARGFHFRGLF